MLQQTAGSGTADAMSLEVIETADPELWNRRLASTGAAELFHRAEWERVYAVYRLETIRLAAVRNNVIVGVLPLVWQKSRLFGNQLVSLPWFDAAGVSAGDAETRLTLLRAARDVARRHGVPQIHLRQIEPLDLPEPPQTEKVLMRLPLTADPNDLWDGFIPTVRNQVRKARKSGLRVESGGTQLLDDFYRVYSHNMRDLGSPPHSRRLLEAVLQTFADETRIYIVRRGQEAVGGGFTMSNGDRLEIPWASSLKRFNRLCVNHLMYWHILEDACRGGYRWFHFGRSSRDSGTYRFKKQWGALPLQLHWYTLDCTDNRQACARPAQESFGWAAWMWQRLPVWLSRRLGPRIIAQVP